MKLEDWMDKIDRTIHWGNRLREIVPYLSETCYGGFDECGIRLYHATRDDLQQIMSLAPGEKFQKSDARDGEMRYEFNGLIDGKYACLLVDCSELPATCRWEEYEEMEPAKPATIVKKRRIVCNEPEATTA